MDKFTELSEYILNQFKGIDENDLTKLEKNILSKVGELYPPVTDEAEWNKIFEYQGNKIGANYTLLKEFLKKNYYPPKPI